MGQFPGLGYCPTGATGKFRLGVLRTGSPPPLGAPRPPSSRSTTQAGRSLPGPGLRFALSPSTPRELCPDGGRAHRRPEPEKLSSRRFSADRSLLPALGTLPALADRFILFHT